MKPKFGSLEELVGFLLDFSRERKLVVVLDEFQNFRTVKPFFFSLQRLWNEKKRKPQTSCSSPLACTSA